MTRKHSYWRSKDAQDVVENFINQYWLKNYRSPTYRNIMSAVHASSTSEVFVTIRQLMENGRIVRHASSRNSHKPLIPNWVISAINKYKEI